jgi:hypothetical protein
VVTTATGNVLTNDRSDFGATPTGYAWRHCRHLRNAHPRQRLVRYLLNRQWLTSRSRVRHDIFDDDYAITDGTAVNFDTRLDIAITGTADASFLPIIEVFEDG